MLQQTTFTGCDQAFLKSCFLSAISHTPQPAETERTCPLHEAVKRTMTQTTDIGLLKSTQWTARAKTNTVSPFDT